MRKGCLFRQWLSILLITLVYSNSYAAEDFLDYVSNLDDNPRSSFWMEYQSHDDNSTDFYMDLGLYLNPDNKLMIGLGESQLQDANKSIDASNYSIQLIHHANSNIDVGIGYSYWGNDDELWTETFDFLLAIHSENFTLRFQPRFTTLNIYTVPIMGTRRLGDTDSEGWGLSLSYYGFKSWVINVSGTDYEYDADLTKLNTLLAQFIFSNTTLLLSDSFLEKSTTLEVKKQFNHFDLGLVAGQSVSAIDHSEVDSTAINVEWFVNKDYSLFFETGRVEPESDDPGEYVTAGFSALF